MTTAALLASVDRNKEVFASLWYRFEEGRLEHARLVEYNRTLLRRQNRQAFRFVPPPMPLWRFTRTNGVRRMVPLSTIRGGEGSRGPVFRCTPQQLDGSAVTCLVLSGELDLVSAPTFGAHLAAAHDADGLLLDLRDLRYIDSSGINALLNAHQALAPSGRQIALVGPPPNVRRILSVLHVEDLMPVFPSVDEALAYLRSGGPEQPVAGA